VQFTDVVVTPLGTDAINVARIASFVIAENAPPLSFRLAWVAMRGQRLENREPPRVAQGCSEVEQH
jgi:hypothetical protein